MVAQGKIIHFSDAVIAQRSDAVIAQRVVINAGLM